ncbi:MAG: MFS transporter [Candidatus Manganitrophus sp.]|nr:MFS transporter [Candidatus Manganitrophus sp.]
MSADSPAAAGAWDPLHRPLFRALWIATVTSNIGTWMQNVAAAWLMTSLSSSPVTIALVQAATSLPIFLLALPAGALADIVDRRRLLLFTQGWMLLTAALLGFFTLAGRTTPGSLLSFTFLLGVGAAMNAPAWQAILPELVPRSELPAAISLNSAGFNIARAVGPALGGLIIAATGPGVVFLLNAATFFGVVIVLYRWPRPPRGHTLPAEQILEAIWTGLRYVRYAPALQWVLIRIGLFMLGASALWALLPLLAQRQLGLGSLGYGLLLGSLGTGAVLGAVFLQEARKRISPRRMVAAAPLLFAVVMLLLATSRSFPLLIIVMMLGGIAWMVEISSLNVLAQTFSPSWVLARSLALFLLVIQGAMMAGSLLWGSVAEQLGIPGAMMLAALGLLLGWIITARRPLPSSEEVDLTPSLHWVEPVLIGKARPEQGPVLVTVEYQIDLQRADEFKRLMRELARIRRRDGALRWGLYRDTAAPGRYLETFLVASWAEHLRQHARVTVDDRQVEERVHAIHIGALPPIVSHFIDAGDLEEE